MTLSHPLCPCHAIIGYLCYAGYSSLMGIFDPVLMWSIGSGGTLSMGCLLRNIRLTWRGIWFFDLRVERGASCWFGWMLHILVTPIRSSNFFGWLKSCRQWSVTVTPDVVLFGRAALCFASRIRHCRFAWRSTVVSHAPSTVDRSSFSFRESLTRIICFSDNTINHILLWHRLLVLFPSSFVRLFLSSVISPDSSSYLLEWCSRWRALIRTHAGSVVLPSPDSIAMNLVNLQLYYRRTLAVTQYFRDEFIVTSRCLNLNSNYILTPAALNLYSAALMKSLLSLLVIRGLRTRIKFTDLWLPCRLCLRLLLRESAGFVG